MSPLRFALVLFLTVALDLSVPMPQHGVADALEEFEEVLHASRGHRAARRAAELGGPPAARERVTAAPGRTRPRAVRPGPVPATEVSVRKLPPPLAESSSAPDAH